MKKEKVYDVVKRLLEKRPELRDSDKRLIWAVWSLQGLTDGGLTFRGFMAAISPETIRRVRALIQADPKYVGLQSSTVVAGEKRKKERTKGTFAYRETMF